MPYDLISPNLGSSLRKAWLASPRLIRVYHAPINDADAKVIADYSP
jgi:hypothetical protein